MSTRRARLSTMIEQALVELDIPAQLRERAISEYEAVGTYLDEYFQTRGRSGCEVYPQGSFRLGTVIRPVGGGDYDIDLVCRRNLAPASTTKEGLKAEVGEGLEAYLGQASDGPDLEEHSRCWTLDYELQFHMDVLPSIPDPEGSPNAILLTDRDLTRWLHSNPIDYAAWFRRRMAEELLELRKLAAQRVNARVEDIPEDEVPTTLQRAVQFLKRHRDVYFLARNDELKPPSILITTLAAHAYGREGDLFDVLAGIASRMGDFVEDRGGRRWVQNPVEPDENFADKWAEDHRLEPAFWAWLTQLRKDIEDLDTGPDDPASAGSLERMQRVLGADVVAKTVGPTTKTTRIGSLPAPTPDPGEEFIEDRFPLNLTDDVRVICRVSRKPGFRDGLLSNMGYRIGVGRSLNFQVVSCTVPEPFDVRWKIKNTGSEAARVGQLRGEIRQDNGSRTHHESTLYRGEHYVECYVIRDGVVRARARHRRVIA